MKRRTLLAVTALGYGLALVLASGVGIGSPGGRGDGTQQYDCGGSCHSTQGTATVSATASTLTPSTGQTITVTITVTPGELTSVKKVGVFLVRALQTSGSLPSDDGWTIVNDPNGGTDNYVEKVASAVGSPIDFTWNLKAPVDPKTCHLYARTHFGSGSSNGLYFDFAGGLAFTVRPLAAGAPRIENQTPRRVDPGTQILVYATLWNATSAVVAWKNTSMSADIQIPMTNTTSQVDGGWTYQGLIPWQNTSTNITYSITATGPSGTTTEIFTLTVGLPPSTSGLSTELQATWGATAIAVLVFVGGVIVVLYFIFGQRLKKGNA